MFPILMFLGLVNVACAAWQYYRYVQTDEGFHLALGSFNLFAALCVFTSVITNSSN